MSNLQFGAEIIESLQFFKASILRSRWRQKNIILEEAFAPKYLKNIFEKKNLKMA